METETLLINLEDRFEYIRKVRQKKCEAPQIFPQNEALFDCSISRLQTCFCNDRARRKKLCRWLIFVVWPRLAAANYGFVQVVDGWMLVRPPAWASGPVTTLTTPRSSSVTRVYSLLIISFSSSECHKSLCNLCLYSFTRDQRSFVIPG